MSWRIIEKLQIPSSKHQRSSKQQARNTKHASWCLELGGSLEVGWWCLVLSFSDSSLNHAAFFHDEFHFLQRAQIHERIAVHSNDVGARAGFEDACFASDAAGCGRFDCGGANRRRR